MTTATHSPHVPGGDGLHPSGEKPGEKAHPADETLAEKIRRYRQPGSALPPGTHGPAPPEDAESRLP